AAERGPAQDQDPEQVGDGEDPDGGGQGEQGGWGGGGEGAGEVDRPRLVPGHGQGQAAGREEHGQGDDERLQPAPGNQGAVDQPDHHADGHRHGDPYHQPAVAHHGRDHTGQGGHRPHGQVDTAGHDHEGHAKGDQPELGVVGQEAGHVVEGQEVVIAQGAEPHQQDEGEQRPLALDEGGQAGAGGGASRGG